MKITVTMLQKCANICLLLVNYFCHHFTELKLWYWKTFQFSLGYFFKTIKWILAKIRLVLMIGGVTKCIKNEWKFCTQPWSYFETFYYFTKRSFHHTRKKGRLLVIIIVCTSCLTSCRRTQILGSKEIRNYGQNLNFL